MRNLIKISTLAAMMLFPGSITPVQAGPSVSISFGLGYSTCFDDDMDLDDAFVLDDSRIGLWVMLPSGQWVLRVRSMWWNAACDDWVFGPWSYDYSVAYCPFSHHHFYENISFYPVLFHIYMNNHHHNWHERYYHHRDGRYIARYSQHEDYRYKQYQHVRVIRQEEPRRDHNGWAKRSNEQKTVIVHETKQPVRIDGQNRDTRIENNRGNATRVEVTRSRSVERNNGNNNRTVTRTERRHDVRVK